MGCLVFLDLGNYLIFVQDNHLRYLRVVTESPGLEVLYNYLFV